MNMMEITGNGVQAEKTFVCFEDMLDSLSVTVVAEDSVPYESPLLGQHGLSLYVEATRQGTRFRCLLDVGQHPDALAFNMERLGIDPATLDAIILTHCHYDHTKGIAALLRRTGKKNLPVVGHPTLFRPHFCTAPSLQLLGVPPEDSLSEITAAGGVFLAVADPLQLLPGLVVTGEIPRVSGFERPPAGLHTVENGAVVPDSMRDDLALAACVRGRGIVVLTACSHAGIVNTTRYALGLWGPDTLVQCGGSSALVGIVGGFHLVEADDECVAKTVEALAELEPQWISAGHCTGWKAQIGLQERLGDRFRPLATGLRFFVEAPAVLPGMPDTRS
jgi:7,8-dihydropterin-6-yl-methyl-4-(beta-D-ribofuranosyl)aminobenzene 5'-phosphate synthase